ncbi:MAG TPA: DUF2147 domain-containing protein [Sphingomicrobium sp.]
MRVAIVGMALLVVASQASASSLEGHWKNPSGSVIIGIGPCGTLLCGTVKWASAKAKADAAKGTDELVGADLLSGVRPTEDNRWAGKLFVPDQKLRVRAKLELLSYEQLRVTGCALGKTLCKSQLWTRTDEPLPPPD